MTVKPSLEDLADVANTIRLPPMLGIIARAIGRDAAYRLAIAFGGGRLNIPRKSRPGGKIAQAIGAEASAQLSAAFPGERLLIPLAKRPLMFWLGAQNKTVREIALDLKTAERSVYNAYAEAFGRRQPDLFDRLKAG